MGGESTWKIAEKRAGVTEVGSVRPHSVLILSSAAGQNAAGYSAAAGVFGNYAALSESALDLSLSFNEAEAAFFRDSVGRYRITVSPELKAVDRRFSRAGTGAALFGGTGAANTGAAMTVEPLNRNALFAAESHIRDFSIEFWINPLNLENGEQIFSWVSSLPRNRDYASQQIRCSVVKNRLQWIFDDFFVSPGGAVHTNIEFSGISPVVPKTWSHHLVRFDAATGMIEYLVNGASEVIVYATSTGRERGDVYTPVTGTNGRFVIGGHFIGLMDEFRIHRACVGRSSIQKYASSGGRAETGAVDLGQNSGGVLRIEATGGSTSIRGTKITSEFRENGRFRFADDSEMQFFIRASSNPYRFDDSAWTGITPGTEINGIHGRYVQLAVDFYPSADGESSPYLDELRIVYKPDEPPLPPQSLTATAVDGGVLLRWKHSPDVNTSGYLIYYSSVRGEFFGEDAALGASPIDAGKRNSMLIDGLKNGTLYYFKIAAYSGGNTGEFSREVTARPLTGLTFQVLEDH
ncbi:MAG: fibronectin type III domain-containing protein [Treponema sp.]|nr:fibronectin type III domain-containing protein [Treponema sp.]